MDTGFTIPGYLFNYPELVLDYVAVEIAERLCAYPIAKDINTIKEVLLVFSAYVKKYHKNT